MHSCVPGDQKLAKLEALIQELQSDFVNLPSSVATDPEFARSEALSVVQAEAGRCAARLAQNSADATRLRETEREVEVIGQRIATLDQEISKLADDAEGLGEALRHLLPHISGNRCPVCDRDFGEASDEPLSAHVANKLTRLTDRVTRLQTVSKARAETGKSLASARREEDALRRRQLTSGALAKLHIRLRALEAAAQRLRELAAGAKEGLRLAAQAAAKGRELAEFQTRYRRALAVRQSITDFMREAQIPARADREPLAATLDYLERHVAEEKASIDQRQQARRDALADWQALRAATAAAEKAREEVRLSSSRIMALTGALVRAEVRRDKVRTLAKMAGEARGAVVRRVFNDALNKIWRDLFIRLAPEEPFIPVFSAPDPSSGPIVAVLKTIHRSGAQGGSPGAMLSAGNLNTAALTLFLALHLSVEPQIPWLVLDDPVQSMDEVHVAQFAALLRTLAKSHSRQILIAVVERALFDYLALELSPSYEGDRLITIELARGADGATLAEHAQQRWEPDKAVA